MTTSEAALVVARKLLPPIPNFPFRLGYWPRPFEVPENAAFEVFWCFQRCAMCGGDIGGYFAIVSPEGIGLAAYHVRCLLRRRERRERL